MKKFFCLTMLLLCAMCFCSCNSNPLTKETPDTSSVEYHNDADALSLITDVDGFMNKSHTYNSDGMYEVIRATDSSWANIYYTDFNSCSRQILCNEPACAHNNDSCRSYIKDVGMLYGLFIFNDNLFIYTHATNEYPVIFQAGLDGSDRKTFFNFSQADSPDGAIAANSTSWYYLHQDIDSTGNVVERIQCLDTVSKRVQTLYTLPQSNEITYYLTGAYNNELIIKTNSFSPEIPTGIYSYNITTNDFTPILEATGNIVCRVADEALVYWQSNQPQIIRHDLRLGTETVLYEDSLLNSYASLLVSGIFDEHLVMIISSSTPLEEADWNAVSPEEKLRWKATLEDRDKHRLSEQSVRRIICRYTPTDAAHYTPHMFRHSFATYLWEQCGNIYEVKEILGHSSVKTTERYVHASFEQQKRILTTMHPRNTLKIEF